MIGDITSVGRKVFCENFAHRMRKCRMDRGYTQAELARRAGLAPATISHFETAGRMPDAFNLARIAIALDVSIDRLLGRSFAHRRACRRPTVQTRRAGRASGQSTRSRCDAAP
jgi:transcriptional regulator with XRE-family HTH domain